jgi:hypothetical protein
MEEILPSVGPYRETADRRPPVTGANEFGGGAGLLNEPVSTIHLRDNFSTLHSLNERLTLTGEPRALACGSAERQGRRSQKHL